MANPDPHTAHQHGSAFDRVKTALMTGGFKAGSRLKADQIKTRFGLSASAAREILLRLTGEGLLHQEENRGFHVPEVTLQSLNDVMQLRALLEGACAAESIAHGTYGFRDRTVPEHATILESALNRDVSACQAAITAHLESFSLSVDVLSPPTRHHLKGPK